MKLKAPPGVLSPVPALCWELPGLRGDWGGCGTSQCLCSFPVLSHFQLQAKSPLSAEPPARALSGGPPFRPHSQTALCGRQLRSPQGWALEQASLGQPTCNTTPPSHLILTPAGCERVTAQARSSTPLACRRAFKFILTLARHKPLRGHRGSAELGGWAAGGASHVGVWRGDKQSRLVPPAGRGLALLLSSGVANTANPKPGLPRDHS